MSFPLKVLFLDIDGVLNGFDYGSIEPEWPRRLLCSVPISWLNKIVLETGCKLVLSSSWRISILNGHMTVRGFETMLRTHGCRGELIGHTRRDADYTDPNYFEPRGLLIADWLAAAEIKPEKYVVLDDDEDAGEGGHPFVHTDPMTGLAEAHALKAIEILGPIASGQRPGLRELV